MYIHIHKNIHVHILGPCQENQHRNETRLADNCNQNEAGSWCMWGMRPATGSWQAVAFGQQPATCNLTVSAAARRYTLYIKIKVCVRGRVCSIRSHLFISDWTVLCFLMKKRLLNCIVRQSHLHPPNHRYEAHCTTHNAGPSPWLTQPNDGVNRSRPT